MEYYKGVLCITGRELIRSDRNPKGILSKSGYDSLVRRKRIFVIRPGKGEGSPALIEYESLPSKYREAVCETYGDPKKIVARETYINKVEPDVDAVEFFANYTIAYADNTKSLPEDKQKEYANNAALLNAIGEKWNKHVSERKKQGKRPRSVFWQTEAANVKAVPVSFIHSIPTNPRRLHAKYNDYMANGYEALISRKFANTNTQKITPEAGEWLVAQFMSQINRCTIEGLHVRYNAIAPEKGWKKLKTVDSLRLYLNKPEVKRIWFAARYGELNAKELFQRQNRTLLPTRRDSLWYSDGTKLNFYYQDEKGNVKTSCVYEVMDVFSEVFLGNHISDTEDFEAQFNAFKMAVQTSGYKPYELKYDNQGGHKKLENSDFLHNLSDHAIRTAPYNGKSKTIESAFGRFQRQYLHEAWYFTGQNITASKKESRANMEFILANTKRLPTLEEAKAKYKELRDRWNNDPHHKTGESKMLMYRSSVNGGIKKVGIVEMIDMFGVTTKLPSTYTAAGIEIEVKKKKYAYEVLDANGCPDLDFNRRNVTRKFYVRYQPDDMSFVSLFEKDATGDLRFITIAQPYLMVNRAMQDQTPLDLHIIRQTEHRNKEQRIEEEKNRNAILEKHGLHPNQHGLNVPPLKGITTKKKKKDIGEIQKELSNITQLEEETKLKQRKVREDQRKAEQEQKDKDEEQREWTRNRIKFLELNIN